MNNRLLHLTLDTWTTKSIIRINILENIFIQLLVKRLILKTSTADQITVYGEARVRLTLGHNEIQATVADIVDDFILGLDIMIQSGFLVGIRNRILKIDNEEILLGVSDWR